MSIIKKLAGETAIYGLSSIIGRVLNYLLVPFYTRIFLAEEYGVVAELYALSAFVMVFFSYRFETAFFRFGTKKTNRERAFSTALTSIVFSTIIWVALLFFFSESITHWLQFPDNDRIYVQIFALILGFDVLSEIPFARMRLEQRPVRFATIKLTNIGLNIFFNLFFLVACPWILTQDSWHFLHTYIEKIYNPAFGVGYVFLSNLIASFVTFILVLPYYLSTKWHFDKRLWAKMIKYAAPLMIAGLAGIVNEMLDRELLKQLLPYSFKENMTQIGIYAANYKLAMLMTLFIQAFRYAAEPFFFAHAEKENAGQLYADVGKYFAIVGALAFLGITLYIDFFKYFVGSDYRSALYIVPILLLANLFLGLYYNLSTWYKLSDKTKYGAIISVIGALITIVLNVVLIPKIGFVGSAWATLVCYVSMTVISYLWSRKYYPIDYDVPRILMYIGLAIGAYYFSNVIRQQTGFGLLPMTLVNTIIFAVYLGFIWMKEREEIMKWR